MRIAICGGICSGKTTLANELSKQYGLQIHSFANYVKYYATEIFGMEYKNRKLIQTFAEKMKDIDSDVWINMLDKKLSSTNYDNIVIDDLRFQNEYDYLRKNDFLIVRLNLENIEQLKRIKELYKEKWLEHTTRLNHVSEIGRTVFKVDIELDGTKSCEELVDCIKSKIFNKNKNGCQFVS